MTNYISKCIKVYCLAATIIGGVSVAAKAAPGDLDTTFNSPYAGVDGMPNATTVLPNGKILVANLGYGSLRRCLSDGTIDSSFSYTVPTYWLTALEALPDGKILLAGSFNLGGPPSHLIRLHADGSLDTSFSAYIFNAPVYDVMVLPTGKYIACGAFTTVNTTTQRRLARINPDGSLDSAFAPNIPSGSVVDVNTMPDGRLVVAGDYSVYLTSTSSASVDIGTFDEAGDLTASGPSITNGYSQIYKSKNGGVYAANTSGSNWYLLDSSLSIDPSFSLSITGYVNDLCVQEDGSLVIGGYFTAINGTPKNNLAKISATGVLDSYFVTNVELGIDNVVLQDDGKIIITGALGSVNSTPVADVARIQNSAATSNVSVTGTGSSKTITWSRGGTAPYLYYSSFEYSVDGGLNWTNIGAGTSSGSNWSITTSSLPPTATIRVLGLSDSNTSHGVGIIIKELDISPYTIGALDTGFNPNANAVVHATAQQPDGKMIIAGNFTAVGGVARTRIARLNLDGTLDSTFTPSASLVVHAILVQPDGKIVVSGEFGNVNGVSRNRIARLNADGTLDTAFTAGANGEAVTMALQPDGKILIGGSFTSVNGISRNRIARLNADGTLDSGFDPNASSAVRSIALQPDGKIVVGGVFANMGGVSHPRIVRLNSDGTLDTSFYSGANDMVLAVAVQADGKILIGGLFTSVLGTSHARMARVNSDGSVDSSFIYGGNDNVYGITLQANGKIFTYGHFTLFAGVTKARIACLNPDGTLNTAFTSGANDYVYSVMLQDDGMVVMGGTFTSVSTPSTARSRIARVHNDLPNQNLSVVSPSRVQWLRGGGLPEAVAVWFETSTDGGTTWTSQGNGTRVAGGWELSGLTLPSTGKLRARALTRGGKLSGSNGLCEAVKDF